MATQELCSLSGIFTATQPEQTVAPTPELRFSFSPSIGKLVEALAKASMSFEPIKREAENPFYKNKYADLSAVIDATRKHLGANGLVVLQPPVYKRGDSFVQVVTMLAHTSGEWIKCTLDMNIGKQDAQGIGGGITYGRRYSYSAILNVASEEDDDGNSAVSKKPHAEETNEQFDKRTEGQRNISVAQIQEIDAACKRTGKTEEEIVAALGFIGEKRIEHLKINQFQKFLKWANGTKKATGKDKEADEWNAANRRLWALVNKHDIPEGDVKQCAHERYKVEHMTQLTPAQLNDMTQWVTEVAAAVQES